LALIRRFHNRFQVCASVSDITAMSPLHFVSRWGRRPAPVSAPTTSLRAEVRPPSLCHRPDSPWQRLLFWLLAPAPRDAAPPLSRLPAVRREFLDTLSDIASVDASALGGRIDGSRSLRELWHLRTEVYRVVAVARSQAEAEHRLAALNRHFPMRAPRAAFALL
jgi:hypothetical protein